MACTSKKKKRKEEREEEEEKTVRQLFCVIGSRLRATVMEPVAVAFTIVCRFASCNERSKLHLIVQNKRF